MHYEKFADGNTICIEEETELMWPSTWVATRLKNIIELLSGRDLSPNQYTDIPNGIPYITGASNFLCGEIKTDRFTPVPQVIVYKGDLLITCKGTVGELAYCPYEQAHIARQIMAIRNSFGLNLEYICNCVRFYVEKIKNAAKGLIPGISREDMLNLIIPLPPLNEQVKINSQINVLMKSIKSIDEKSQSLTTDIGNLKSKILDLAIRGKLVSQNPDDEPASILLERIRAEKEELIKQGKIKRDKKESIIFKGEDNSYYEKIGNSAVCIDHKLPFTLPDGWTWCVLPEIAEIVMGSSPDGTTINNSNEGIEFHQGKIFFTNKMLNPSDKSTTQPSKIAPKDSVLLCVRAPVGELNITDRSICIGRGLASIHPYHYIDAEWLFYWLQTYKGYLNMKATGSTFVAITADIVKTILIPLPPLEEQKEILKTINKVFFMVDLIEKSLS